MKMNRLLHKTPLKKNFSGNLLVLIIFLLAIQLIMTDAFEPLMSQETNPAINKTENSSYQETVLDWIRKGGSTMILLGLISSIILGFALERYWFFKKSGVKIKNYYYKFSKVLEEDWQKMEEFLNQDNNLISRILKQGILYKNKNIDFIEKQMENVAMIELGKLEKGLNLLSNLGNLAPLIGFFGTVIGMRNSFIQFVIKVAPTAKDLAGGVEEALITTQAGLLIAIPTYLIYHLFIYWIDSLSVEIERCGALLLTKIQDQKYGSSDS